eukprot:scaffold101405_cov31-Prasinocladus_malaysianus.AAC.1
MPYSHSCHRTDTGGRIKNASPDYSPSPCAIQSARRRDTVCLFRGLRADVPLCVASAGIGSVSARDEGQARA